MTGNEPTTKSRAGYALIVLAGLISMAAYLAFRNLQMSHNEPLVSQLLTRFYILIAVLFLLLMVVAITIACSRPRWPGKSATVITIFVFAALFRFALIGQTPWLSDDIYRYLWDARVLDHGINPYRFPPAAEQLKELRDSEVYPNISHKEVRTVYPPLLQSLFWTGTKLAEPISVSPSVGLKTLFVLIDLLLIVLLVRLLAKLNLDTRWVVLYAWHPLAIIEIASNGHNDGAGALCLIAAILLVSDRRFYGAAVFLALAFLIKFISILLLPFLFFDAWWNGEKKIAWRSAMLFALIVLVGYAPFWPAGENLLSGLLTYSSKWRFNDGAFSLIYAPVHRLLPDALVSIFMIPSNWKVTAEVLASRRIDLALLLTKAIVAIAFLWIYWRTWRQAQISVSHNGRLFWPSASLVVIGALLLLSPTLHPWYLLWVLPLLCLFSEHGTNRVAARQASPAGDLNSSGTDDNGGAHRTGVPASASRPQSGTGQLKYQLSRWSFAERFRLALWLLSGTVFLSYWVLKGYFVDRVWQESGWVKWIEFGIPAVFLLVPRVRR